MWRQTTDSSKTLKVLALMQEEVEERKWGLIQTWKWNSKAPTALTGKQKVWRANLRTPVKLEVISAESNPLWKL